MKMDMFCKIMNRIRKTVDSQGEKYWEVNVRLYLVDGTNVLINLDCYELLDDFVQAFGQETKLLHFIPVENIISASV